MQQYPVMQLFHLHVHEYFFVLHPSSYKCPTVPTPQLLKIAPLALKMVSSHFVNSHFVNSHFVNSHLVNIDKAGIDKMGIDEVGS